jgi:uncharacterized protein (TIGR02145 family)
LGEGLSEGEALNQLKHMNKFTNFKSFNPFFTFILFVAVALMSACGGDDEPDPEPIDCSTLALTATAEGFTITASATGGEGPYQFKLEEGTAQSSTTFTVEEPGSYEITVIDANDCEKKTTVQVVDPCANFSVSATASAYDLTIAITDGTAPFSYSFENGDSTYSGEISERTITFELMEAENTIITITDENDCNIEDEVEAADIESFTDSDDQTYKVVKIGTQIWLAENYNKETEEGSYCYDNEESNCETYGKLYTWNEATSEGFAPEGWELPSEDDFQALINTAGGGSTAAAALLVEGSSGFEFQMAGRYFGGEINEFDNEGSTGYAWTTGSSSEIEAITFSIRLGDQNLELDGGYEKVDGLSVRLIKNN